MHHLKMYYLAHVCLKYNLAGIRLFAINKSLEFFLFLFKFGFLKSSCSVLNYLMGIVYASNLSIFTCVFKSVLKLF